MADEAPAPAPDTSFSGGVSAALDDMRSSAKWLLGAFAATGAVIFAGLQLTSLGDINSRTDSWRIPTAMTGFGVTIIGIALAIGAIGGFLRRTSVNAKDFISNSSRDYRKARESLAGDPTILGSFASVQAVWDAYGESLRRLSAGPTPALKSEVDSLNRIMKNALTRAKLVINSRRYRRSLILVAIGAIVAAAGAGTFAVAAAQPKETQAQLPTLVRPATAVDVRILGTSPHRSKFQNLLGGGCELDDLSAVVLEQDASETFVLGITGTSECHAAELTVNANDAIVSLPAEPPTSGGS